MGSIHLLVLSLLTELLPRGADARGAGVEALQEVLEKLRSPELPPTAKKPGRVPSVGPGGSGRRGRGAAGPRGDGSCLTVPPRGALRRAGGGSLWEALQLPPRHRLQPLRPAVLLRAGGTTAAAVCRDAAVSGCATCCGRGGPRVPAHSPHGDALLCPDLSAFTPPWGPH